MVGGRDKGLATSCVEWSRAIGTTGKLLCTCTEHTASPTQMDSSVFYANALKRPCSAFTGVRNDVPEYAIIPPYIDIHNVMDPSHNGVGP
jgi:hypothetical protein